ncbi:MAG TPA: Panacea domain-containing protein [Verrucomicrobiae bacterium]|nr:Panacea domain-containing protein [Verrucomicrobiae bacterium]
MAYSSDKMQHVILFFLERINNVHLGRKKLMKLLYYVDFDHYEMHGKSVTGATYRKLPHGPVPKEAKQLIEHMAKKNLVKEVKVKRVDYAQHRLIAQTKFDASLFSGEEIQTLERVAKEWENCTGGEIEAASHAEAPWSATKDGKDIDYDLAYYRCPTGEEPLDTALAKSPKFAKYVAALR